jgi:hypothetical protein
LGQIRKNDPNLQGANPPWDKDSEFREEKYNGQIGGLGGMGRHNSLKLITHHFIGPGKEGFSLKSSSASFI